MPDNDTTADSTDRGIRWDMETQLAAILPGLSDEDLTDLASRVGEELELRVGTALSAGLTNQQLEEFEKLMDGGDDRLCNEWMDTHRPDCRATVATVLAELVAEVVRTVTATNPDAAQGNRVVAQLRRASIELAEAHFNARGIKHTRHDDQLRVVFAGQDDGTETVVWIAMAGRHKDTFTLTGFGVGVDFPPEERERVCAFAADWNQRTWHPKAVVMTDEDTERCKVIGEIAVSIGPWITRAQVDVALGLGVAAMFALFADVRQSLVTSDLDASMASIDAGESVIEA